MAGHKLLQLRSVATTLTFLCFLAFWPCMSIGIRHFRSSGGHGSPGHSLLSRFNQAPKYRNRGGECSSSSKPARSDNNLVSRCDPKLVHVAMTLDFEYLRGSVAAVNSVLFHARCPENIFFHFIAGAATSRELTRFIRSTFRALNFKVYIFREHTIVNLISSSIRQALGNPLNYARSYLGEILNHCLNRVIYLDSDVILVDDIYKLWKTKLRESRVIGAPEYCHANFTKYFTDYFWSDPDLSGVFELRRPCYFNTGVMVMDLRRWREGNYKCRIESWMEIQRKKRIYNLGSLPPFLLEFAGDVEAIDHRWNQHGLGGDNILGSCRSLHPGPVSLLHWSGKGKPWLRLDMKNPCPTDYMWKRFDLYKHHDDDD